MTQQSQKSESPSRRQRFDTFVDIVSVAAGMVYLLGLGWIVGKLVDIPANRALLIVMATYYVMTSVGIVKLRERVDELEKKLRNTKSPEPSPSDVSQSS